METQQAMQISGNSQGWKKLHNRARKQAPMIGVTLLGLFLLLIFILPLGYMVNTAFKLDTQ
ncbi:MAG: hypothetical protein ABSF99_08855, partial [Anaerolineales bacterium]